MGTTRRCALLAFMCSAAVLAATTTGAGPAAASAREGTPSYTAVVGVTSTAIVYNDQTRGDIYLKRIGSSASPTVFDHDARAIAVAGDLIEYDAGSGPTRWYDLATHTKGLVPSTWKFLGTDGGLWLRTPHGRAYLDYRSVSGAVTTATLPRGFVAQDAVYSVVAGASGVAVTSSAAGRKPVVLFAPSNARTTFTELDTSGVANGSLVRCQSVSRDAVGCLAGLSVLRFATNGVSEPQVSTLLIAPVRVAVTAAYTSWTAPTSSARRTCPCTLASIDITGTAQSVIAGVTSAAVVSGGDRFYYSSGRTRATAGIYSATFAGGGDSRVAAAPTSG